MTDQTFIEIIVLVAGLISVFAVMRYSISELKKKQVEQQEHIQRFNDFMIATKSYLQNMEKQIDLFPKVFEGLKNTMTRHEIQGTYLSTKLFEKHEKNIESRLDNIQKLLEHMVK